MRMWNRGQPQRGFSLVELLIVMAIVAVMFAVALPQLVGYFRSSQIRAAANDVAGEIQAARVKAIMNNVQTGVMFAIVSPTTYRFVIEDDLNSDPLTGDNWTTASEDWSVVTNAARNPGQLGPLRTLPPGVQFNATCENRTGGGAPTAVNSFGFRFNALGTWCAPTTSGPCPRPSNAPTAPHLVNDPGGTGTSICLTYLTQRRWVTVTSGGKVQVLER